MQVKIDPTGESKVVFTKTEVGVLRRAQRLCEAFERNEAGFTPLGLICRQTGFSGF